MSIPHEIELMIKDLQRPAEEVKKEQEEKINFAMNREVGFRHPIEDVGVHCREDRVLELFAGNTRVILDGNTGSIIMNGANMINNFNWSNYIMNQPNSFAINGSPLYSFWYDYTKADETRVARMAPVSQNHKGALNDKILVAGKPAEGQYNVSLSAFLEANSMFVPPTFIDAMSAVKAVIGMK